MKKQYEAPKAEKLVFDYQEIVVTSANGKDGKYGHSSNACYTHNGSDVYEHNCNDAVTKNKNQC